MRMHIHISLPRRLRSGMRSIARRIESGPARGRERPGANEGKSERLRRTGASERDGGNKEIREERGKEMYEERRDREKEIPSAKDREGKGKDQKRRDVERRGSRIRPSRNDNKIEGAKERSRDAGGGRAVARDARGRRRARTAVVNGNNCCGRCHSKARVPNARCQTVVRVITVITWYRDIHAVCDRGNQRPRTRCIRIDCHAPRAIVRFVIDSRLESSGRGKCSDERQEGGREDTGLPILDRTREKDGRKVPKWSSARLAGVFLKSLVLSERRSLLETDAYRETDKRRRGLMILRRRLGRIMRDLREDELEPVFPEQCRPRAQVYVRTRTLFR